MPLKLTPVTPPFSSDVENALSRYPKNAGYLLRLFRVFANSVRFLKRGVPNLLDDGSPLSLREREIIILRVTANTRCEYEWGVHVATFAEAAEFSLSQIRATECTDIVDDVWTNKENGLFKVVDELMDKGCLNQKTLRTFREHWSKEQQLEICALCGTYQTVSYVANIAEIDNEPFGSRFAER